MTRPVISSLRLGHSIPAFILRRRKVDMIYFWDFLEAMPLTTRYDGLILKVTHPVTWQTLKTGTRQIDTSAHHSDLQANAIIQPASVTGNRNELPRRLMTRPRGSSLIGVCSGWLLRWHCRPERSYFWPRPLVAVTLRREVSRRWAFEGCGPFGRMAGSAGSCRIL